MSIYAPEQITIAGEDWDSLRTLALTLISATNIATFSSAPTEDAARSAASKLDALVHRLTDDAQRAALLDVTK